MSHMFAKETDITESYFIHNGWELVHRAVDKRTKSVAQVGVHFPYYVPMAGRAFEDEADLYMYLAEERGYSYFELDPISVDNEEW